MKNTVIPQADVDKLKEVIEKAKDYVKSHKQCKPALESLTQLNRIHSVLYMRMVKELISTARSLESLLECSEEEFIKTLTDDGKITVDEVEKNLMLNVMMEMLKDED